MFFLTVKAFLYVLPQIAVKMRLLQRIIAAGEGDGPVGTAARCCAVVPQCVAVSACCGVRGLHAVYPDEGRPKWDVLPTSGCRSA